MTLRLDPAAATWLAGDDWVTSLEDVGLTETVAWEDVDLDTEPWSPCRPALRPLAGAETSCADPHVVDIDIDFIRSWEARTDEDDQYALNWLKEQRDRLEEASRADPHRPENIDPLQYALRSTWTEVQVGFGGPWIKVATCTICQSIVKRNQYAQHWLRCKDDVGQGEP